MMTTLLPKEIPPEEIYCGIMEEIKLRLEVITDILNTKHLQGSYRLRDFAAADLCCVQLRMVCELIALSCLVAHGDRSAARSGKLIETYQADKIINALDNLHSGFYPVPSEDFNFDGKKINMPPMKENFLTKQDLKRLYHACGDHLHRGTLERIFSDKPDNRHLIMSAQQTVDWATKIMNLLRIHTIQLIDPSKIRVVLMEGPNNKLVLMLAAQKQDK